VDAKTKQEIDGIIRQLNNVARELDSIAQGVETEFKGIGSSMCAKSIRLTSDRYNYLKNELSKIK
jgi:hypothetical protein